MNIGFFGGSFDPIHRGHISLAQAAAERYALRQVLFVTAGVPPHKRELPVTPFVHRHAMVALATQDEKQFVASLAEAPEAEVGGQKSDVKTKTTRVKTQSAAEVKSSKAADLAREASDAGSAEPRVNYTIDTVRRLKATLKKSDRLFLLIGIDAFRDIAKWRASATPCGRCCL